MNIRPRGIFHKLLSSREENGNKFGKSTYASPQKCAFATCPGNNSHLGEHRCLKTRSEMPVGIWADGALGLGTSGLLPGFCHTKKTTVPMGCCSWERFGSSSQAAACCPFRCCACVCIHTHTHTRTRQKNQTAASHALLHDCPEEKHQLPRSEGGTSISPPHPAQPHHAANSLRACTLRAPGIAAKSEATQLGKGL